MTISQAERQLVRERAGFACEYCGVDERDSGGELTIDHHQPTARGGTDHVENLVYSCPRCNLYKADYWPAGTGTPELWNPRREPQRTHMLMLADGTLHPITRIGQITVERLRLNRPPLVAYRLRNLEYAEYRRSLSALEGVATALDKLQQQLADLLEDQRRLLEEQRTLIQLLLRHES